MTSRPLVIHTDAEGERIQTGLDMKLLREGGVEVIGRKCLTEADVIKNCGEALALLNGNAPITRKVLESLPKLKVVCRYGVGYDNVDTQAATDVGVAVAYVPDYCYEEVSNHALMFILSLAKALIPLHQAVQRGEWSQAKYTGNVHSVRGDTLGIVGTGRIGMTLAKKAQALSMNVIAYDPYVPAERLHAAGITPVSMNELFQQSDFVSIHVPLNPQTRHSIGREQFRLMKKNAFFINTSRGPVVDESALVEALNEGRIAGAGLDVYEKEPPVDSPLLKMNNVVLTPHSAVASPTAIRELYTSVANEVLRALRGEFPLNVANPAVKKNARLFAKN